MAIYKCRCGKDFTAREADRNRGWARFCSKSCKATEQEGRTGQNRAYQQRKAAAVANGIEGYSDEQAWADNEAGWDGHKNAF